ILRGQQAPPENRARDENGEIVIHAAPEYSAPAHAPFAREERFSSGYDRRRSGRNGRNSRGERSNREPRARRAPCDDDEPFAAVDYARSTPILEESRIEARVLQPEEEEETAKVDLAPLTDAPIDVSRVRTIFPFGISRSRLTRVIKQLG